MPPTQEKFPGLVYLCWDLLAGQTWCSRHPKYGKQSWCLHRAAWEGWDALVGQPCWGFGAGEGAGACGVVLCCVAASSALALRGAVEDAAAADAQGDFPSWWHYCARCWRGNSSSARGCLSSGGSQGCVSPARAFPQGPEPWERELQLLPLSIPVLLWL